jgi:acetyl esterase/lipase
MSEREARASLQAYLTSWLMRRRFKPRLKKTRGIENLRKVLTPSPYIVPVGVSIRSATVGGVPGEWVEEWVGERVEQTGGGAPAQNQPEVLLYLHGGGYFACSAETHRPITVGWARQGFRVFAANYRLAPEHRFPAALEDALAAYRALRSELDTARPLYVAGDSAGGGLALALLVAIKSAGVQQVDAAVAFSPWTDLSATGESLKTNDRRCAMFCGNLIGPSAKHYLGDTYARHPLASPLWADLTNLPPLLIHVSRDEVLLDDSGRFTERAGEAGVAVELKIWPEVPHAWQLKASLPESKQSLREAAQFLRRNTNLSAKAVSETGPG